MSFIAEYWYNLFTFNNLEKTYNLFNLVLYGYIVMYSIAVLYDVGLPYLNRNSGQT